MLFHVKEQTIKTEQLTCCADCHNCDTRTNFCEPSPQKIFAKTEIAMWKRAFRASWEWKQKALGLNAAQNSVILIWKSSSEGQVRVDKVFQSLTNKYAWPAVLKQCCESRRKFVQWGGVEVFHTTNSPSGSSIGTVARPRNSPGKKNQDFALVSLDPKQTWTW